MYYSLLQANSSDETLKLFFYHLVEHLDGERPEWRKDTVLQLDGASYHTSDTTQALLKRLNVPTIISGPYQYKGAAVEMLWAHLKRGDLNPEGEKLSKSKYPRILLIFVEFFSNIVGMVHERMKKITKPEVIMFFHHTMLELFK